MEKYPQDKESYHMNDDQLKINTYQADEIQNDPSGKREPKTMISFLASKFTAGSIKGSIFELMVATIGSGVLALPAAFAASGLYFSIFQLIFCAFLGYFSTMLLAKCGKMANKYSYTELAEVTYGPAFQFLVKFIFFLNNWGGCVVYTILITNCIGTALGIFFPDGRIAGFLTDPNGYFWPPIYTTLVILPLSLLKNLSALRYTSLMSFIITVFLTCVIVYESTRVDDISENFKLVDKWKWLGVAVTFPNAVYSYSCHPNVLDVFHELQRSSLRRMGKVLFRCMAIACIIYVVVGIFGYITFADDPVKLTCIGNVLMSFRYKGYPTAIVIALIFIGVSIVLAMPLSIKPSKDALSDLVYGRYVKTAEERQALLAEEEYVKKQDPKWRHIILVLVIVYSQMLCGMFVQKMSSAITLLGASAYPMINFIFPCLFYLKLANGPMNSPKKIGIMLLGISMFLLASYSTYAFFASSDIPCPPDSSHHCEL